MSDSFPALETDLLRALSRLAADASRAILAIAHPKTREKPDLSPVTEADEASEAVILAGLKSIAPPIPVVSEESATPMASTLSRRFFLVDPLDGTREFIAGRAEFTVNIALIEDGVPLMGVITAPALGLLWCGIRGEGAARMSLDLTGDSPIRARAWPASEPIALVSRSHLDPQSSALLAPLPGLVQASCGSAVKFCRLAEGSADIYPRLAPTREWDVAAGHALLAAAGGTVVRPDGSPLRYGERNDFLIPGFLALADPESTTRFLPAA